MKMFSNLQENSLDTFKNLPKTRHDNDMEVEKQAIDPFTKMGIK